MSQAIPVESERRRSRINPGPTALTENERRGRIEAGLWLRQMRRDAGMTLDEAAVIGGLRSTATLSLIEEGMLPVPDAAIPRLALVFQMPPKVFALELLRRMCPGLFAVIAAPDAPVLHHLKG